MSGIHICITVDWEGEDLSYVRDLKQVRKRVGHDIPFTHFICPNYFVKEKFRVKAKDTVIDALEPVDEVGLHIHCYRDLIEKAVGLPFRTEQNYHNPPGLFQNLLRKAVPFYTHSLSGRGVPLSVYGDNEIEKIVTASRDLLCDTLELDQLAGFRVGGWIANDSVLDVVEKLEFRYDSSAVPPSILSQGFSEETTGNHRDDYGDRNGIFTEHILGLWGYQKNEEGFLKNLNIQKYNSLRSINLGQQPFYYDSLLEIPNNVGLTDFCSGDKTVLPLLKKLLDDLKNTPDADFVIVYGCHQEGDSYYKTLLVDLILEVLALKSPYIQFSTMNTVCNMMKQKP